MNTHTARLSPSRSLHAEPDGYPALTLPSEVAPNERALRAYSERLFSRTRVLSSLAAGLEPPLLLRAYVACTVHTRAVLVDVSARLDAVRKELATRQILACDVSPRWHGQLHERSTSQWIVAVESARASNDLAKAAHAAELGAETRAMDSRARKLRKEVARRSALTGPAPLVCNSTTDTDSLLNVGRGKVRHERENAARAAAAELVQIAAAAEIDARRASVAAATSRSRREREISSARPRQAETSTIPDVSVDVQHGARATGTDAASQAERLATYVRELSAQLTQRYTTAIVDIRGGTTTITTTGAAPQGEAALPKPSAAAAKLERRVATAVAASLELEQRCASLAKTLVAKRAHARIARAEAAQRDAERARSQRVQSELHRELHALLSQGRGGVTDAMFAIFARQRKQRFASAFTLCRTRAAQLRSGAEDTFRIRKRILQRERIARGARLALYCCESPQAARADGSRAALEELYREAELNAPAVLEQLQRDLDSINDIVASELSILSATCPRGGVRGVYVKGGASVAALLAQCIAAGSFDAELASPPTVRKWRAAQAKRA